MSGKDIIDKAIAESGGIWKPSCAIVNDASNLTWATPISLCLCELPYEPQNVSYQ
jgi:hypothetical protein